jgi:hypothetical protein
MDSAEHNDSSIRPPVPKQKKKYQSWLATDIVLSGKKGGHTPAQMSILLSRSRPLAYVAVFWLGWFIAPVGAPAEALGAPKKTVLVLYGERLSIPAMRLTEAGLSAGLSSGHGWDLEVFSEYLDLARFPTAQYGDDLVRHLRAKYAVAKARPAAMKAKRPPGRPISRQNQRLGTNFLS